MAEYLGDGVYRIGKAQRLWSVRQAKLDDAVLPAPDGVVGSAFGWLRGDALPIPGEVGCYVVEFLENGDVRLLAYVDGYGRIFDTQEALVRPPARQENMLIAHDDENPRQGSVFVRTADGGGKEVATYGKRGSGLNAKYSILDSEYDFGAHGANLHYYDFMARAYLVFAYRPSLPGAALPVSIQDVYAKLNSQPPAAAFADIVSSVRAAEADPSIAVAPIVSLLAGWLVEVGADSLGALGAAAKNMRIIHTIDYANVFYLAEQDPDEPALPEAMRWAFEGALNRFLLLERALGDRANRASMEECLQIDRTLFASVAIQKPLYQFAEAVPAGVAGGEWMARCRIAAAIENLVAPLRIEAPFHYDHQTGDAIFTMRVPPASLFGEGPQSAQAAQAYAAGAALFLVAAAFGASESVHRVRVTARPIFDAQASGEGDSEEADQEELVMDGPLWFDVAFPRELWEANGGFMMARQGNPLSVLMMAEEGSTSPSWESYRLPSFWEEETDLVGLDVPLGPSAQQALAAKDRSDIQIEFAAKRRIIGERLARAIAEAQNTADAVKAARAIEEELDDAGALEGSDEGFSRVMASLVEGSVNPADSEQVFASFMGEEPCLQAYERAQKLQADERSEQAIEVMAEAVTQTLMGGHSDGEEKVFRVFDSYWSRLAYNLQRAGRIEAFDDVRNEANKQVQLAPDYLYFCLIDLVNLLESSFDRSDEAIRYGEMAVKIAPTVGMAYRMLGRAYMLSGDLASARRTLQQGLRVMQSSDDIAVAYYQLAYVLWKSGNLEPAVACYAKSIMAGPAMAVAAVNELQELQEEANVSLPDPDDVDEILTNHGVPVAPLSEMSTFLLSGAVAAMDEGLLELARNLLAASSNYERDDVLMSVLRSLAA